MMSSRPTNVPPQMKRICVVSIWMYCCSGCLRPPCGGMLATVPSSIFSRACCTPSPDVAGDGDVVLGFADLVDFVDVDDAALGGFEVVIGVLQQLEQDVFDVLADVAGFGERGGVADGEGDVEDAGQRLGQQRLAAAGRADQQDVALVDLDIVHRRGARRRGRLAGGMIGPAGARCSVVSGACSDCGRRPTAPSWRTLADDVLIEEFLDLPRAGNVLKSGWLAAELALFLADDVVGQVDAVGADVDVAGAFDHGADIAGGLLPQKLHVVMRRPRNPILALWLFVQMVLISYQFILIVINAIFQAVNGGGVHTVQYDFVGSAGLMVIIYLGLGLWIWIKAPRIATRMVSADPSPVTPSGFSQQDALMVAFPIAGVFLLVPAFRELLRLIIGTFIPAGQFPALLLSIEWHSQFWSAVFEAAFALWLIFGARGMVRLVLSMRRGDVPPG
jgi:hypothetical protein